MDSCFKESWRFEIVYEELKTSGSVLLPSNYSFVCLSYVRSRVGVEIVGILSLRLWSEKSKEQNCIGCITIYIWGMGNKNIYLLFFLYNIFGKTHKKLVTLVSPGEGN